MIFTTAHKDYALEGYELNAVDYLLKPFSLERFVRAVNKITDETDAPPAARAPGAQTPAAHAAEPFLYFRSDRKMVKVMLDEVVYIESLKDYIRIVRTGQQPLMVKQPISIVEEMLPDNLFIRIHRSYIISLNKVTAFTQNDVEIAGVEIPIGKLYKHRLPQCSKR